MISDSARSILVGIDGSSTSTASLRWATGLAHEEGGTVSAIAAWNYPTVLLLPLIGTPVSPAYQAADKARRRLESVVEGTPTSNVPIEQWTVMGAARTVLADASEDHDLLVLGRTGDGRLKQLFLGSTVSHCVRYAECPVVVVRDSVAPERKITVAVDGSAPSIEALVWALELGEGHEVTATYSHNEFELELLPLHSRVVDLTSRAEQMLDGAIDAAIERSGSNVRAIKRQVLRGDPRSTIVDGADPSALLVLGAQGHSGLARWVMGSLADYAVQHAPGTVAIWR